MVDLTLDFIPIDEVSLTLDLNSYDGSSGAVAGVSYIHTQSGASSTWTINHNLGFKPVIQLFNTGSQLITGSISHISVNQVQVLFTTPIAGFARML